ncbi:PREDICTED: pre-rRNA processing protein FTSJ3-like [Branchiostoma belcheri]|uniref:Putative rRNA methyltransferase n=1 Tax=Branchiostoma belcheri TaxID=7741 RepID=A0A6P4YXX4_BRABE|nr:PREDICTED: pre-rRNA processing protein FTSJ3-like [Branchiostoma belcheri]
MGKKGKTGQHRKDKFYKLAKETGYRARSAFKLIQLNRKYGFLQRSKVLVDLCAAPGGWLQVAAKYMPVSSLLVGVDLVPIKPIPNVSTIQADITTDKCRQALKKELATWQADCVLHDGAPNVGSNWLKDASEQAQLVLASLRLATEVLNKGGCFVTKVFRSKDYHALLWVFQQLFKHVHATKPQASRHESAEIFVVCEGFLAPDKIDPRFLDPRFAFKEVDVGQTPQVNLKTLEQKKAKAEGYAEGDLTLFHQVNVSEFITSDSYMDMLASKNQLVFDDEKIANHPLTTSEIKLCCQDIKLLGRKDIRLLLRWRKKMKEVLQSSEEPEQSSPQESGEEEEELKLDQQLSQLQREEAAQLKRKKKEVQKERRKLQERMVLKMDVLDDKHDFQEERPLFNLQRIHRKQELAGVQGDAHLTTALDDIGSESENEEEPDPLIQRDPDLNSEPDSDDLEIAKAEEVEEELEQPGAAGDDDFDIGGADIELKNPLLVDLESADLDRRAMARTDRWFSKDIFAGVASDDEDDDDEDDLENMKQQDDKITEHDEGSKEAESRGEKPDSEREMTGSSDTDTSASDSEASDYDVDETIGNTGQTTTVQAPVNKPRQDGFEVVSEHHAERTKRKLDPEGLALGALISTSKKRRRDIVDWAFNRYTFDDEGLPDWFVKDEVKHSKKQLPVTKDMVAEYREKLRAINARPVKKVAEAKARKKRKALKRLEKAKKKAEAITESGDMSDKEKVQQIKQLYKKAGALGKKKPEKTYVVARKFNAAKRPKRPAGLKGPYRVVDPRMKKDSRKINSNSKQSGKMRGKRR